MQLVQNDPIEENIEQTEYKIQEGNPRGALEDQNKQILPMYGQERDIVCQGSGAWGVQWETGLNRAWPCSRRSRRKIVLPVVERIESPELFQPRLSETGSTGDATGPG